MRHLPKPQIISTWSVCLQKVQNSSSDFSDTSLIWANWGGKKPLSTPRCGFDGKGCPIDFWEAYKGWIIAAIIAGICVLIGILTGVYYVIT